MTRSGKSVSVREHLKDIRVPVYSVGGWYDNYVESDLDAFAALSKRNHADRIMIGPWPHVFSARFPDVDFGKDSQVSLRPEQIEWFDHWLKGDDAPEPAAPGAHLRDGHQRWRDEDEWPLARARNEKFYLGSGLANARRRSRIDDSQSTPDSFVYDPRNPVPTMGGAVCCNPKVFPWGPMDQRSVEKRRDVLVYSTRAAAADTGSDRADQVVLYASSTAPDTDFTAKLVDVFPDGDARNLTDGILRVRYRDSLEEAEADDAGRSLRITIDAGVTSNVFRAGHRIRLEISSSNFPRFDRNPNTGVLLADAKEMRKATQTVYHDHDRHSYLLLPVIPVARGELTTSSN